MESNDSFPNGVYISGLVHMHSTTELIEIPTIETALLGADAPEWLENVTENQNLEWLVADEDDRDRKLGFI